MVYIHNAAIRKEKVTICILLIEMHTLIHTFVKGIPSSIFEDILSVHKLDHAILLSHQPFALNTSHHIKVPPPSTLEIKVSLISRGQD